MNMLQIIDSFILRWSQNKVKVNDSITADTSPSSLISRPLRSRARRHGGGGEGRGGISYKETKRKIRLNVCFKNPIEAFCPLCELCDSVRDYRFVLY